MTLGVRTSFSSDRERSLGAIACASLVRIVGAATAEVRLLYQPTSWEYVQFLNLANNGQVSFLASTGEDLLDAWFATGGLGSSPA